MNHSVPLRYCEYSQSYDLLACLLLTVLLLLATLFHPPTWSWHEKLLWQYGGRISRQIDGVTDVEDLWKLLPNLLQDGRNSKLLRLDRILRSEHRPYDEKSVKRLLYTQGFDTVLFRGDSVFVTDPDNDYAANVFATTLSAVLSEVQSGDKYKLVLLNSKKGKTSDSSSSPHMPSAQSLQVVADNHRFHQLQEGVTKRTRVLCLRFCVRDGLMVALRTVHTRSEHGYLSDRILGQSRPCYDSGHAIPSEEIPKDAKHMRILVSLLQRNV